MSHTGVLPCHGITDKYDPGWVIYEAERLAGCWYITFSPCLTGFSIGPFYLVAVSKEGWEHSFGFDGWRLGEGNDQKIISGGQTGADRAALEFCCRHNLPYGGWVQKGEKGRGWNPI